MKFKKQQLLFILACLLITVVSGCANSGSQEEITDGSTNKTVQGMNLSSSSLDSSKPVIAADIDGNVFVAWEEAVITSLINKEIYLAKSDDSGVTFSSKEDLTDTSMTLCERTGSSQTDIRIAAGGSAYLAWKDFWDRSIPVSEVKFFHEGTSSCDSVSKTFGQTPGNIYSLHIASPESGNAHMVWAEDTGSGMKEISYVHSVDSGTTFLPVSGPQNLSKSPSDSR